MPKLRSQAHWLVALKSQRTIKTNQRACLPKRTDRRVNNETLTGYIKNWADSAKFQLCNLHLTLCWLTDNRSEMSNLLYTKPLGIRNEKST
jgi:hypothetical protein